MRTLLTLALWLSLPGAHIAPPPAPPADAHAPAQHARSGGRWYMTENGHAVYCYGPVMMITQAQGGLQRVATFCRGDQAMVPLKD